MWACPLPRKLAVHRTSHAVILGGVVAFERTIEARGGWLAIRSGRTDVPNNGAGTFMDTHGCFHIRQIEMQDLLLHATAQIGIASLSAAAIEYSAHRLA